MDTEQVLIGAAAIPVIVALLEILKAFVADRRVWPVIAVLLGVGYTCLLKLGDIEEYANTTWPLIVIIGITIGLGASGLYSGTRTIRGG